MNTRLIATPLACLIGLSCAAAKPKEMDLKRMTPVAQDQVIPATDFFRPAYLAQPTLNREGNRIAAMVSGGGSRYQLMLLNRVKGTRGVVSGKHNMDIYNPIWLSNDRVCYSLNTEKLYRIGLLVVSAEHLSRSYPIQQSVGAKVIGVPRDQPLNPLVWLAQDDRGLPTGVYKLDARRKAGAMINLWDAKHYSYSAWSKVMSMNKKYIKTAYPIPGRGQVWQYIVDRDGELAFALTMHHGVPRAHYLANGTWVDSPLDLRYWKIIGAGNGPYEAVALKAGSGPGTLYFVNLATGDVRDMILRDQSYDFEGTLFRAPGTGKLLGVMYNGAGPRTVWFDKGYRDLQAMFNAVFPGQVVRVMEVNDAGSVFLLSVGSDRHPQAYHVFDVGKHTFALVAESRPWLDTKRMRPMQIMKYQTAEGKWLDAYFTLPEGASKKNPPPLVVLPHGGPWVRDVWGFNPEVQFLASRGYAVLQPNYRGSPGYAWMFSQRQWKDPEAMSDDVTRAARTLISSGLVDGKRVAIMGASFGGYLALMGAVHEPDLYRCAVSFAGVFDWADMVAAERSEKWVELAYQGLLAWLGDPASHQALYDRLSPGHHVAQIKIPVFVAHGTEDRVVSVRQSLRLISELEEHHIEHESMIIHGEGHGTFHVEDAVKYHNAVAAFLKKHL